MKAVILAGGLGTRLSEETLTRPKPMVEIGSKPILWHIMKIYSSFGIDEFIICCGYKGYMIKEYFANYFLHNSDITFDLDDPEKITIHNKQCESWKVTLVDTGENTETGGRLRRIKSYLDEKSFFFTYGDGVANINLEELKKLHFKRGKMATMTAVQPPGRFGALKIKNDIVEKFQEKPDGDNAWINGGFFILEPKVLEKIDSDNSIWEIDVLPRLVEERELIVYKHEGFWHPMDTMRDRHKLNQLWNSKKPPWKLW